MSGQQEPIDDKRNSDRTKRGASEASSGEPSDSLKTSAADRLREQAFDVVIDPDNPELLLENKRALQLFIELADVSVKQEAWYEQVLSKYQTEKEAYEEKKQNAKGLLAKLDAHFAIAPKEPHRDLYVYCSRGKLCNKFSSGVSGILASRDLDPEYNFMLNKMLELEMVERVYHTIEYGLQTTAGYRLTDLGKKIYQGLIDNLE